MNPILEKVFIKYYKTREDIKYFLSTTFNYKNRERGITVVGWTIISVVTAIGSSIYGSIKAGTEGFLPSLLYGLGMIIFNTGMGIFNLAGSFFSFVTDTSFINRGIITGNSDFLALWTFSRDLANMAIVLGFVVVGIATSLRIENYQAKKLLKNLIIIAILVNFSGLFCGIIIDASNITMDSFLKNGGGSASFAQLGSALNNYMKNRLMDFSPK